MCTVNGEAILLAYEYKTLTEFTCLSDDGRLETPCFLMI